MGTGKDRKHAQDKSAVTSLTRIGMGESNRRPLAFNWSLRTGQVSRCIEITPLLILAPTHR